MPGTAVANPCSMFQQLRLTVVLLVAGFQFSSQAASWYVDNAAGGANSGSSWANAWTSFAGIQWASIQPGDTLFISGGSTGSSKT